MARVNLGVSPQYLSDQHLIAEAVEITMITGSFKKHGFKVMSPIPKTFNLGTGHINFFKNKLVYLKRRLNAVKEELQTRGITHTADFNISDFPEKFHGDYTPTFQDTVIIRSRIKDRLINPILAKPGFHKYKKTKIDDISAWAEKMVKSPVYYV